MRLVPEKRLARARATLPSGYQFGEAMLKTFEEGDAPPTCPKCSGALNHDRFEDMWGCRACYCFYYPEDLGLRTNVEAGIFHIGDKL